jgi:urease accessory protein
MTPHAQADRPGDSIQPSTQHAVSGQGGWLGHLELGYAYSEGKSFLLKQERKGPLFVQKPFYPEGPQTCHTYVLHPPGGVVGGDTLNLEIMLAGGSHALVTTPSATKFYRSAGPRAIQINRLQVAAGAVLEWLPQENIIYNGADAKMRTMVQLNGDARFIGWEMTCLGLPAGGQPFIQGRLVQHFEIRQDDRPLLIEPLRLCAQDPVRTARWGLSGQPVSGILAATVKEPGVVQLIRECTSGMTTDGLFAVTRIQGLTLCRFIGADVYAGLKFFRRAWEILRPAVLGRVACAPRIWAT